MKKSWIAISILLASVTQLAALSQLKIICDKDNERIYINNKFKAECDQDEVIRLIVKAGTHRVTIKKRDKGAKYLFTKVIRIGDGIQKVIESYAQPVYNEYHYYENALKQKNLDACNTYLKKYPKGKYRKKIEEIKAYLSAKRDFSLYNRYLRKYPKGQFVEELKAYYFNHPLIATLSKHSKPVLALAISEDNRRLFSGGTDNRIIEWNLQNKKPIHIISSHSWIKDLALSPDEKTLAFGGELGIVDLHTYHPRLISKSGAEQIGFIDDKKLAGAVHNHLSIWNVETGKKVDSYIEYKQYDASLDHLTVSPDKRYLFYDLYDRKNERTVIRQYDIKNRKVIKTFSTKALKYDVRSLAMTPDGRYLISGSKNDAWYDEDGYVRKTLIVWDIKNARPYRMFAQKGNIDAIAVDPRGKIFAYGTSRGEIFIRQIDSGELLTTIHTYSDVNDLLFTKEGKELIGALDDGSIKIWYSALFDKKNRLNLLLQQCKEGDFVACNDYILNGGRKTKAAKNAILHHFKVLLNSKGNHIRLTLAKVYLQDSRATYHWSYSKKNYAIYTVQSIISDKNGVYLLIDVDYHNTGFTFSNPIYLSQNGRSKALSKRIPDDYEIKPGTRRMKLIFVYKNMNLKKGNYAIKEGSGTCEGCMNFTGGHIAQIL